MAQGPNARRTPDGGLHDASLRGELRQAHEELRAIMKAEAVELPKKQCAMSTFNGSSYSMLLFNHIKVWRRKKQSHLEDVGDRREHASLEGPRVIRSFEAP